MYNVKNRGISGADAIMKIKRKPMRLQHRILVTNMCFFVLPCLILCVGIISVINTESNRRLNQSRIVILNQINTSMEYYLNSIVMYSENFMGNYEINRLISKEKFQSEYERVTTRRTITEFMQQNKYSGTNKKCDLKILGENGVNYSISENVNQIATRYPDLEKLKEEEWFAVLDGKSRIRYIPTWQSEEFQALGEDSAVRAIRLIKNFNSGRCVGIFDVNITHTDILNIFAAGIELDNQEVMLMDDTGTIITSTNQEMIGRIITSENYLKKLTGYDHGYFQAKVNGSKSQVYFVTSPSTQWKIIMYEKRQGMVWSTNQSYVWIILALLVFFALEIIMSIVDSRYISRPVRKLKRDMRNVYKGDLSVRTEVENMDEFGELSQQFNMMIERIEQLIEQLKEKDEEKRVLELQALQAQINPHFLYNTLASIRFQMEMGMEDKAGQSLMALVKLLRRTFSDYRKLIPIREELQALETYLVLMENRYQDTFEWKIDVDEEIMECLIPRISIQPLVENSISHGFSEKKGMGHIRIEGRRQEQNLVIRVLDDGEGADVEKIKRILEEPSESKCKEQVSSIGLKNVQERLQLFFGEEYGLSVSQTEEGGVCVELCMPAQKEREAEARESLTGDVR